jgi:hypothetical protein
MWAMPYCHVHRVGSVGNRSKQTTLCHSWYTDRLVLWEQDKLISHAVRSRAKTPKTDQISLFASLSYLLLAILPSDFLVDKGAKNDEKRKKPRQVADSNYVYFPFVFMP